MKKILIATDHAGFKLKEELKNYLSKNYEVVDLGTNSEESVDYPDFGKALAKAIEEKKAEQGILICGSGIGISIAANRNPAVRAALVYNEEAAKLARQHNNANVIALGARFIDTQTAIKLVDTFLTTSFEGGRHENRVKKLSC
jgi:ribose 5-phosphate isomerase B